MQVVEDFLAEVPIQLTSLQSSFQRAAGEGIAVAKSEMEVHALRVVKQEENVEFDCPQSFHHTEERQYQDPTMIELPLAKFQRALDPIVEQMSATVQISPYVETDNEHHTNGLERFGAVTSSASELEDPPNARATDKAQVVAEMVEYAFVTCEGSNYNSGTRMMVSKLLQFLSKQYEEDKASAGVEIERLKDEKMKLNEEYKLAVGDFQKSKFELEELKKGVKHSHDLEHENEELRTVIATMGADMEELKKGVKSSRDLELENEELKTVILTMGADMDVLKGKHDEVQRDHLSITMRFEKLKKEMLEQDRDAKQQVNLLKMAAGLRDKKIHLQNEELTILRERVGKAAYDIPAATSTPPVMTSNLKQVPQCDPVSQESEEPQQKRIRLGLHSDSASGSIPGFMDAISPQKFGAELNLILTAIMTLGKALDSNVKLLNLCGEKWKYMSGICPRGYPFDSKTVYKMVWNNWISTVMFFEFEDMSFGLKEAVCPPQNLDALTKPGKFDGTCSRFLAFVRRKHQLLFPPWMYQAPLLKILDADVYSKFKVVAEKIWMLHQMGRRCGLPPSIFRPIPLATRYDTLYHESRTLLKGVENAPHVIMFVFMPGFVVEGTVIKSQVSVKKM